MLRPLHNRLFGALLALAACVPAVAMTRVTLLNGFSVDCASTAPVDATHTRLLMPGNGYQDILTAEIARVETVADVPSPSPSAAATNATHALPAPLVAARDSDPTPAELHQLLSAAGSEHDLDADLLAAVVKAESAGHTHAVSRAGARGLMQLMPATAAQLGVADSFRAEQNIRGGTAYLDALLHHYGDNLALALAAFNAGPGTVDRFHGVPPYRETRAYVARIIRDFNRRKLAAPHSSGSLPGSEAMRAGTLLPATLLPATAAALTR